MRSFSPAAQAAMDSGALEPYLRVGFVDTDPNSFQEWIEPVSFKLTDTEAEVIVPIEGTNYADGGYFALRRGVVINGTPEYTTTSSFTTTSLTINEKYYHLKGTLLPPLYKSLAPDLTWKQVLDRMYFDELNPTTYILAPTYEIPSHAVWSYKFYPAGRSITFNTLQSLFTIFKQKFLIFGRHTENTYTFKIDLHFYQPTETRAVDYSITDLLFEQEVTNNYRRLLWRDDANTTTIYNPYLGSGILPPLHNLGYIPTAGTRPSSPIEGSPKGGHSSKLSPNLKYESGDYVTIVTNSGSFNTRIQVEEIFEAGKDFAWHMIIKPCIWFSSTEGGAMPSTIQAAAPYTPLNTSHFNNNLSSSDNNIQAAMETIDDLPLGTAPTTTAINDFQVGDGAGNWIKKTLAQAITILGIFADAASDSIYYVRRNAGWTNLKTYTDTLYALLVHTHTYSQIFGTHGLSQTINASVTEFMSIFATGKLAALSANPLPFNCTLKNLRVRGASGAQPASGSLVITLYNATAAASTGLTVTIAAGSTGTVFEDLIHTYSYTAGDLLRIDCLNNATGASKALGMVTFEAEKTTT